MILADINIDAQTWRLFLHLIGATVWVGGQITLGVIVPVLRGYDGATRDAARRFQWVAWPAYALLVLTGGWNLGSLNPEFDSRSTGYQAFTFVKLTIVAVSGVAAYLHSQVRTPALRGLWGGVSAVTAVVALWMGEVLSDSF